MDLELLEKCAQYVLGAKGLGDVFKDADSHLVDGLLMCLESRSKDSKWMHIYSLALASCALRSAMRPTCVRAQTNRVPQLAVCPTC